MKMKMPNRWPSNGFSALFFWACLLLWPAVALESQAFGQDDELQGGEERQPSSSSLPGLDASEISDALALIRQGQAEAGVAELRRLGELGNPDAFFHLAEINRLGAGKEESRTVALMYYRFAAQMGHKRAALSLANLLFFEGKDDAGEYDEAITIWKNYAAEGEPEAMYLLGMVYWNGEAGLLPDPVRGYGLVWRAAELDYRPAIEAAPAMKEQLSEPAQEKALAFGRDVAKTGIDGKPLALDLVTDDAQAIIEKFEEAKAELKKPEDWNKVWHLEVGFAMGQDEAEKLRQQIIANPKAEVGDLFSEVIESANRPDLYRLIFGPIEGMTQSVRRCVSFKRAGYDCFAKPPSD